MDPLEIVQSTADATFATDEEGRIVIWNKAAERLLGHTAARVLGKPCHEILCGLDVYGNRFCDEECSVSKMARRGEPIRRFEVDVRTAAGEVLRATCSMLCLRGPRRSQFTMIHLLQPVASAAAEAPAPAAEPLRAPSAAASVAEHPPLTARELEVLRHLAGGAGTREIADSLFISVATVRTHLQNILGKLEVHSQVQAVSVALRNRLI